MKRILMRSEKGKLEKMKKKVSEYLQSSEGVSSLCAYTHHSECSLWEHKSVDENENNKKQKRKTKHRKEDSSGL